jgi:hypothetical protein
MTEVYLAWTIHAMPAARVMNLTAVFVTRFGNVPVNQFVRRWLTEPPPADSLVPLHRWVVFNNIRSLAAVFGFVLILIVDTLLDSGLCPGSRILVTSS